MRQLILNFQNDSEPAGGMKTSSSLAGSLDLANPTVWPESDSVKKMNATYGSKCLERFGKFNHVGSWAKMFSALLIGRTDWYSTRCKLTWKLKGTKYNRLYFQLQPSTLPTEETGFGLLLKTPCAANAHTENLSKKNQKFGNSGTLAQEIQSGFVENRWPGLLPTPTAMDSSGATANMKSTQVKEGSMHSVTLSRALGMGLLPTPTAVQREHPERVEALKASGAQTMFSRANGEARPNSILDYLNFHGMLPTPCARDFKGDRTLTEGKNITANGQEMGLTLEQSARIIAGIPKATSSTSQLSPRFVMEMMGFPPDWTELPFLSGDKNQ